MSGSGEIVIYICIGVTDRLAESRSRIRLFQYHRLKFVLIQNILAELVYSENNKQIFQYEDFWKWHKNIS